MLMKKTKFILLISTIFLSINIMVSLLNLRIMRPVYAQETPYVTMFLDPPNISGLNLGDTFDIILKIQNFTDLYGWQAGLTYDPDILEATNVQYGKLSWSESIFAVLAPTRPTNPMAGTIDNANGQIYPPYAEALTGSGGVTGASQTTAYNLMKITFKVKDYAPTGTDIKLITRDEFDLVCAWTQWPDVGLLLGPTLLNATVSTVAPALPSSPVANFTWTPTNPIPFQNITFDASSSLPGYDGTSTRPITQYRWDWDNDGNFDTNTSTSTTIHSFEFVGNYSVTLEVYAPGSYPPEVPDTDRITRTINVVPPPPTPTSPTMIYVEPGYINASAAGQIFNVKIKIKDFINMWSWQVGLAWDPSILNCTSVTGGPSLSEDVFNVLAPGRYTIYMEPSIDNSKGLIYPPAAESLTFPGEGVTAAAGVGYTLLNITFISKTSGICDFHLQNAGIQVYGWPDPQDGQTLIRDIHTVKLIEGDYTIEIITNSTSYDGSSIYAHTFYGPDDNKFTFNLSTVSKKTYADYTQGFVNITIPKALLWVDSLNQWIVLINGEDALTTDFSETSTHYILYFTYNHKTNGDPRNQYSNIVEIIGTHSIPEYPSIMLLLLLLVATAIIILAKSQIKHSKKSIPLHFF